MLTMTIRRNSAQTIADALTHALECRDAYTAQHTRRVAGYAELLAAQLGFSLVDRRRIHLGAAVHDIGKVGIPDHILKKAGRLTDAEYEQMKSHTVLGADIVASIPEFTSLVPIVRHHHEHWDGWGYPDGLVGDEIEPAARLVAVVDAFDAMTSDRAYRPAMSSEQAFREIESEAGRQFDPDFAAAFLELRPQIEMMMEQSSNLLQFAG